MIFRNLFLIAFTLCLMAGAAPLAGATAPEAVLSGIFFDQPVILEGHWSADQKAQLLTGVTAAGTSREKRQASLPESTIQRSVIFKLGETFSINLETETYRNTVAKFGSGVSGLEKTIFTIPPTASAKEISDYLTGKLPALLLLDDVIRFRTRRMLGKGLHSSACDLLLSFF